MQLLLRRNVIPNNRGDTVRTVTSASGATRTWPFGVLDTVLVVLAAVGMFAAIAAALTHDYDEATFRFVNAWFCLWIVEVTSR